jgi:antitoxin CptB
MQDQLTDSGYRRLAWQCRRGMRELDELLSGFLAQDYAGLDAAGRATFDALLAYPDAVLLELLMGRMTPADKDAAGIVRAIRNTAAV